MTAPPEFGGAAQFRRGIEGGVHSSAATSTDRDAARGNVCLARLRTDELIEKSIALAILGSTESSIIATSEQGVVQLFNAGAERMLGYAAADVVGRSMPADILELRALAARAAALSRGRIVAIAPGFASLVFEAAQGVKDIFEMTCVCKDGNRLPAIVSVTALRDEGPIVGYLFIIARTGPRDGRPLPLENFRLTVEGLLDLCLLAAPRGDLGKAFSQAFLPSRPVADGAARGSIPR